MAEEARFSSMDVRRSTSSYKDEAFLVQASLPHHPPSPSSPITITAADGHHHLSTSQHFLPPSAPRPSPLCFPTPSTSIAFTSNPTHQSGHPGHFDWRPVLLTPPPSCHGGGSIPSRSTRRRDPSAPDVNPSSGRRRFDRKTAGLESPTLATRRAKKHSQPPASALESLCLVAEQTLCDAMSSARSPSSSSQKNKTRLAHAVSRAEAPVQHSHKMLPPFKSRALTLDGADRPTLPPMLGHVSPNQIGPIRSSSFSTHRHSAAQKSNPYFISTPRRSVGNTRSAASLSPQTPREAGDPEAWSPYHAPWTPTSSVRSTSAGLHYEDALAPSHTLSRTLLGTPLRLDSSPLGSRQIAPSPITKKEEGGFFPATTFGAQLPSSHLAPPNSNALGLFLEPSPFPNELLHLDLGSLAHRASTPRSEADFFLASSGNTHLHPHHPGRSAPHMLTRSPAAMSDLSSQTPSPSSYSDDSLPKLSLGHRYGLDARKHDVGLPLPALHLHDSAQHTPASTVDRRPASKQQVHDFLYKMPILRGMSPLADMSSDSEEEDFDEPLAGPSTFPNSPCLSAHAGPALNATTQRPIGLPEEGSTGEIFLQANASLPLVLQQGADGDANTSEKLFCKLDSTTHQCFSVVDGKWACYRRNYLKVDVSFRLEDEQGRRRDDVHDDLLCSPADRRPFVVERFAVHMTAHVILSDGRLQKGRQGLVPLIQFGPARERGPRENLQPVELRAGGSISKDASANEQAATRSGNIAAFRRVQIRSATMNNGQRGSAGQQFYALKLTLLAYPRQGAMTPSAGVELASLVSHPITVRGRSKVHYAAPGVKREPTPQVARRDTQSTTRRGGASSSRLPTRRASGGAAGEHRRSTRLQLAASHLDASLGDLIEDADDECEGERHNTGSRASRVMDIRSVI